MRIVSWNCRMALHDKWSMVLELAPDILLVQEAACPAVLRARGVPLPEQVQWVGGWKQQGLLAVAFGDYRLRVAETYFPGLHWVLPLQVDGPEQFTLLATYDLYTLSQQGDPDAAKSDALITALARYRDLLADGDVVLAGDLNNSVTFDRPRGRRNFSPTLEALADLGYVSAYHSHRGEGHGAETEWTFYLHYGERAFHHIDFCFVPAAWRIDNVAVGGYEPWVSQRRSDHAPVVVDVSPT
ncbi:endonuclease/exonuclease/phosphatase family protein [Blastococcus sp. SYSU D00669]